MWLAPDQQRLHGYWSKTLAVLETKSSADPVFFNIHFGSASHPQIPTLYSYLIMTTEKARFTTNDWKYGTWQKSLTRHCHASKRNEL